MRGSTTVFTVSVAVILVALIGGMLAWGFVGEHDQATVTIQDENCSTLATVDAEVADTPEQRYTGLSDHESLENGSGMLFVFDEEDNRTFVMRDMAFPIDIIFIGSDGRITEIHEAPVPEGESPLYNGSAQWVLEVPYGYADANNITIGDRVSIEYENETEGS